MIPVVLRDILEGRRRNLTLNLAEGIFDLDIGRGYRAIPLHRMTPKRHRQHIILVIDAPLCLLDYRLDDRAAGQQFVRDGRYADEMMGLILLVEDERDLFPPHEPLECVAEPLFRLADFNIVFFMRAVFALGSRW